VTPHVLIKSQPGLQLVLSVVGTDGLTAYTPEIKVLVTNIGLQAITAYALRFDALTKRWQKGGVDLADAASISAITQPGQSKYATLGIGVRFSEPIEAVEISIDFVEFANGTTWGSDSFKSGELLAGKRAGAQALVRYLKQLAVRTDMASLLLSLEDNSFELTPEANHSAKWLEGFRSGVASMRSRIRDEQNKGGVRGIESALARPFDAHDELMGGRK